MNETYSTVFHLLRNALFPDAGEPLDHLDNWTAIFEEMRQQTVAALPYDWLKAHQTADFSPWLNHCLKSQANWIKVMNGQAKLLALLEENGIACVILKGAAAAMAYPQPSLRSMGDVDFLVRRADVDRTAQLLEANGYRLEHEKRETRHHYEYTKDGIEFELHWRMAVIPISNERLLSLFEEGISNRQIRKMGSFSFPVLPDDLNGLVLVSHINHHLRKGLGLRQIIDWMMYVDKMSETPTDIWTEKLRPLLKETGMEKLALCVTVICQRHLGLMKTLEGCETVDIRICDELLDFIMEKGNFGRKSGEKGKIAYVYLDLSNPCMFFKRLQIGGMKHWNAAKKHAILRPFAWIYQIGLIAGWAIKRRISPQNMMEQLSQGAMQRELIKKLGLEVDKNVRTNDQGDQQE